MKQVISVKGMHCRACELRLEDEVGRVAGVQGVQADSRRGLVTVTYAGQRPDAAALAEAVRATGYEVGAAGRSPWLSRDLSAYRDLAWGVAAVLGLYLVARETGVFSWHLDYDTLTLPLVLAVGLVAGVSTCAAVTGSLVVGLAARFAADHPEATPWRRFRPHLVFNLGRVGGYALLGALLGAFGSVFRLSVTGTALVAAGLGLVMVGLGVRLMRVSPRFDDLQLSLPPSLARRLGAHRGSATYRDGAAALSGALTFFLPCGFTQAMQLYAMGTGSALRGALIMGVFALGTAPSLLGLAGAVAFVRGRFARRLFAAVGVALVAVGLFGAWTGLRTVASAVHPVAQVDLSGALMEREAQVIRMTQRGDGYYPDTFTVKRGRPVHWIIESENEFTCASSIVIPQLGITRDLRKGENVIDFTPTEDVDIGFSCAMGMFQGRINVED